MNYAKPINIATSSIIMIAAGLVVGKVVLAEKVLVHGIKMNILIPHPAMFIFEGIGILLSLVFIYQGYRSNWSFLYESGQGSTSLRIRSGIATMYVLLVTILIIDMYWHATNTPTIEAMSFVADWGVISTVALIPPLLAGIGYWWWNR